ncbi:unnamed protein product [Cladocopium goreaui]|uniref:Protein disulfide-isomerase n=1 Tax=Cladocopium goreaui TaxID=2562237 RepID=A0A9P1BJ61_9DINO|nr:unnamed protein product [Cladocopium goreaui]|mmetsp:Transcript_71190/g.157148  ORF Transcript_71190/g.157148 Transcript_71190/m.157148 type:complete len:142 (+) Transcript_71190:72-497(+)
MWAGKGYGYGKGGYGYGYDMMWNPMMMQMMMGYGKGQGKSGLITFPNDKKVFIGGLPLTTAPDIELNKRLKEHMTQAGACLFAEVGRSAKGGAAFKTREEVQKAVEMLNGSEFEGSKLQVETWGRKPAGNGGAAGAAATSA